MKQPSTVPSKLQACPKWAKQLSAIHQDDLSFEQRLELRNHLETCSHCQATEAEYRLLDALIVGLPAIKPLAGMPVRLQEMTGVYEKNDQRSLANNLQEERILPLFTTRRASRRFRVFGVRLNLAAATLVLVAILIACTAVLFPFIPGSGNTAEAKQYQLVGLSQSSHGTTFVADKAYASEGGTIIQFHVQPSPDLMKFMKTGNFTSTRPGTFTIKDQTEELKSSAFQTTCYSFQHSGWPIKCALVLSAFHLPANVTTLTLTWDVSSIFLGNNGPDGQWSKEIQGTWHFHFVINFHHGKFLPALSGA